jgi:hypothetical protein
MARREVPKIPPMRPEPQRDRWGRYKIAHPDTGEMRSWTRATTLAHAISDTHALTQWQRRKVLEGAALRPDLLTGVTALAREIDDAPTWREAAAAKAEMTRTCDAAADAAGANDGSKLGTALHTITEYADAGRLGEIEDLIPTELYDDLAAYLARMADAGIERPAEYIERVLVNTQVDAAGTTDRIVRMPAECEKCGSPWKIADLKTQKSVDFGFLEIAIQLAEYANADVMVDEDTGEHEPMPVVCRCTGIVMHLPVGSGECTLYEVDLVAGWEAATLAFTVRQARSQSKQVGWPYSYVSTTAARIRAAGEAARKLAPAPAGQITDGEPDPSTPEHARVLVRTAGHPRALVALWEDLDGRGLWTAELTQLAAARKAELAAEGVR